MSNKEVTIIILTYKSTHIIRDCLKKIIGKNYRIIIVDNGSQDNLTEILTKNYKNSGIEVVFLENNVGFSKGNNIALKKVKTKYALLLNPDAIIDEKSIDNMVIEAKQDNKIAMVNPLFFITNNPTKEDILQQSNDFTNNIKSVDFICCGASLMTMSIFKKIGFLDENIFLYGEDDEISHRAIVNNYKNIIVKNSFCHHINQGSIKIENNLQKYKILYFRYWHRGWGKTYLKRKHKNIIRIWLKIFHRLFLSIFYLLKFNLNKAIIRFAIFMGSISNLIGINCFNKNNKIPKIKKELIL